MCLTLSLVLWKKIGSQFQTLVHRKHLNAQNTFERETRRLEKMFTEVGDVGPEVIQGQEEKTRKLQQEVQSLEKEIGLEEDKLTTYLLNLVSRENHYASSVVELMKIKKQYYENAYNILHDELPKLEGILRDTPVRPIFGENIADHLRAIDSQIAFPIALSVTFLRQTDLEDEGLFRISTQQIKLDKLKAHLDARLPFINLLQVRVF